MGRNIFGFSYGREKFSKIKFYTRGKMKKVYVSGTVQNINDSRIFKRILRSIGYSVNE